MKFHFAMKKKSVYITFHGGRKEIKFCFRVGQSEVAH